MSIANNEFALCLRGVAELAQQAQSFNVMLKNPFGELSDTSLALQRLASQIPTFRIPAVELPDFSGLLSSYVDMQRSIQASFVEPMERIRASFCDLPPRTRAALKVLAEHGWYVDMNMAPSEIWEFQDGLMDADPCGGENALAEYFESQLDGIEHAIVEKFPNRGGVIRSAFAAHRRQEYELSIPAFLQQVDGMWKEVTGSQFFIRRNGKPGTAAFVERAEPESYRHALLSPLASPLPITASQRDRPAGFSALNRHAVVHGECLDYGTRLNGLRAISLINYVAQMLTLD